MAKGEQMKITCSNCYSSFNLPQEKIPARKAKARCTKCGGEIVIDPVAIFEGGYSDSEKQSDARQEILFAFPELSVPAFARCNLPEILTPTKKGAYNSSKNKFKVKIIKSVSYLLNNLLTHDEQVLRVGHGVAFYPSEIIFGNGAFTRIYNNYAIFATNRRLLFVNVNPRITQPKDYLFQLPYENISKARFGKIFSRMVLKSVLGPQRVFNYMKRHNVTELRDFINKRLQIVSKVAKNEAQAESICPACFLPVNPGRKSCPYCEAAFKTPLAASLRSLLLPGWGDMYLGHRGLGMMEMLGSLIIWGLAAGLYLGHIPPPPEFQNVPPYYAGLLLLIYNGGDALLTYIMGRKGYILA